MKAYHGIIPPVVTPLTCRHLLDVAGLERLLSHILSGGVQGVFVLGTTGEGPALDRETQGAMMSESVRIVAGRVPVLAGISSSSFEESVSLGRQAAEAGCSGVVCAPPCYFNLGEPELMDYYRALVSELRLPLFLYNMPSMTKVYMKPEWVCRLAALKGIGGYKDSSGNMADFHEVLLRLKDREDFSLFVGPEELLGEAVLFGADGGIPGGANLNPGLFVAMYQAALAGDVAEMRRCQARIYAQRRLYGLGRFQSSMIKGLKSALRQRGICEDYLARPFNHFEAPDASQVAEVLAAIDDQASLGSPRE